ncbi:MAG: heme exporter protein CcmB, partial [Methyloprofundus sp.]|nr:heme exporter protein CcmB [Methyloprofundus sp.]
LPLYIPVLIFGAGTVQAGAMGLAIQGYLALLAAILVLSLMLAPFAISAALKISVRS